MNIRESLKKKRAALNEFYSVRSETGDPMRFASEIDKTCEFSCLQFGTGSFCTRFTLNIMPSFSLEFVPSFDRELNFSFSFCSEPCFIFGVPGFLSGETGFWMTEFVIPVGVRIDAF